MNKTSHFGLCGLLKKSREIFPIMSFTHNNKKKSLSPFSNINIITYHQCLLSTLPVLHSANELHSGNSAWLMLISSKRLVIPLLKKYENSFQHQLLTSTKRVSAAEKTPASKFNGFFLCHGETQETKCLVTNATVHCPVLRAVCDFCRGQDWQQIASC